MLSGPALWQWQSGDKEKGWEEGLENWSLRFPPEPSGGQSHLVALGLAQDGSCMVAGWGVPGEEPLPEARGGGQVAGATAGLVF